MAIFWGTYCGYIIAYAEFFIVWPLIVHSYCKHLQKESVYSQHSHHTPKFDVTYTKVSICAYYYDCCVPASEYWSEFSMQSRTDHQLATPEERGLAVHFQTVYDRYSKEVF